MASSLISLSLNAGGGPGRSKGSAAREGVEGVVARGGSLGRVSAGGEAEGPGIVDEAGRGRAGTSVGQTPKIDRVPSPHSRSA